MKSLASFFGWSEGSEIGDILVCWNFGFIRVDMKRNGKLQRRAEEGK